MLNNPPPRTSNVHLWIIFSLICCGEAVYYPDDSQPFSSVRQRFRATCSYSIEAKANHLSSQRPLLPKNASSVILPIARLCLRRYLYVIQPLSSKLDYSETYN